MAKAYFNYWGKADLEKKLWKPVVTHMLEVASVAYQWANSRDPFCKYWSNRLGIDRNALLDLISFIATIHDLGKFSYEFQSYIPELLKILSEQEPAQTSSCKHPSSGFLLWDCLLWEKLNNKIILYSNQKVNRLARTIRPLLTAGFGHHGKTVDSPDSIDQDRFFSQQFKERDKTLVLEFFDELLELFPTIIETLINWNNSDSIKLPIADFSFILSGLVILADWTASNFPLAYAFDESIDEQIDLNTLFKRSLTLAYNALKNQGLESISLKQTDQPWAELFPNLSSATPTSLQQSIIEKLNTDKPSLFVIEDIAGAGKTEAALLLTQKLMHRENADGFYIGLPTMATSNGIYNRLQPIYKNFYDNEQPSLVLAHSHTNHHPKFQKSLLPNHLAKNDIAMKNGIGLDSYAACNAWLADNRKKAFLAQVGVGSLDQALLAIIYSKHNTLRMFGLANKILIIDEVHAYDSYMQVLLETLIEFQARQGKSVVLLSATLPNKMKGNLCQAYHKGCSITENELEFEAKPDYPLVTIANNSTITQIPIQAEKKHKRNVGIKFIVPKTGNLTEPINHLIKISKNNQCAVWIRNTVADVQDAYEQIIPYIDVENVIIFHSRFMMGHRNEIENQVLNLFGKTSTYKERSGKILLATQVVEQSLDLDFDEMIIDLCPMDLVIQRIGRLRRHRRDRAGNPIQADDKRGATSCMIFGPEAIKNATSNWYSQIFKRAAFVYRNPSILWRTAKLLQIEKEIKIPERLRYLIENTYTNTAIPIKLVEPTNKANHEDEKAAFTAIPNRIRLERGFMEMRDSDPWPDHSAPTRLTEDTLAYRLCLLTNGMLQPLFKESFNLSEVKYRPLEFEYPENIQEIIKQTTEALPDKGRMGPIVPFEKIKDGNYQSLGIANGKSFLYSKKHGLQLIKI